MKITKRQLRRIIREAIDPREMEEPLGGWAGDALTRDPDFASRSTEEHARERLWWENEKPAREQDDHAKFSNASYDAGVHAAESGFDPDPERYDNDRDYADGYNSYDHLSETRRPYPAEALPTVSDALSDIYDGIDKLIQAVGPEEALRELVGIIDDWDETPYQGKQ